MSEEKQIKIIVDQREFKSNIPKELFKLGTKIETATLQVGDFICSEKVCVERKTVNDFVNSLIDKRLFSQVKDMKEQFDFPVLIIEGAEDIFSQRNIHPNAIRGAIASLAVDYGISLIQTSDAEETARMIYAIARREQGEKNNSISLRGKRSYLSEKEYQEFLIEGLPLVGPKLAKELLKEFGNVENIFKANEEELQKIPKIGKKKAKNIRNVITKDYNNS